MFLALQIRGVKMNMLFEGILTGTEIRADLLFIKIRQVAAQQKFEC
jgi:hypothetical protein